MAKILVAYHSQTGNTREAATVLARRLRADIEPIAPVGPLGPLAYLGRAMRSVARRRVEPSRPVHDPALDDLVVLAGPVWFGHISPELHGYIARHREFIGTYAALLTCGGAWMNHAHSQIRRAMRSDAVARTTITDEHRKNGKDIREIEAFSRAIEKRTETGDDGNGMPHSRPPRAANAA